MSSGEFSIAGPHVSTGWEFSIAWEHTDREISGMDTSILGMPKQFWADLGDGPALLIQPLSQFLKRLCETQAGDLGEKMHHADWVITRDPAVVRSRGLMHDCDECRRGVQTALRFLEENPDDELLVGSLYWAAQ